MKKIYYSVLFLFFSIPIYAQPGENNKAEHFDSGAFSLRTNLPTWFLAVPSLGMAYKPTANLELLVDATYAAWKFKRKGVQRHHNFWNISPQVRTYIGQAKSTYLGIQYSLGEYNISRQQGQFQGGGLAVGKQYFASKNLLIDIGLTLGFLQLSERENYSTIGSDTYRTKAKENVNYWGPTALSIRLSKKIN